ncbi:MAG: hypothetical protein RAO92_01150 [Candidatus Euphemobacter frigidus]|nr:hypothetical protein [Candidatus Euphemobacter frigidus]MDP8274986.1 hypothetical protein [Candidatus Euphemobacter frigidus]
MRWIIGSVLLMILIFSPGLPAQDNAGPEEFSPEVEAREGPGGPRDLEEGGMRPTGRHFRGRHPGGRKGFPDLQFKQFRREVKVLGAEIRENKLKIQSLEEELETMEPGVAKAEVRRKLNEIHHRQAELRLELAHKKVNFTRRARDIAQERYDEARLDLEKVSRKIKKKYPDLDPGTPPPDI